MKIFLSADKKYFYVEVPEIKLQNGDFIEADGKIGTVRHNEKYEWCIDTSKRIYDATICFSVFYQGKQFQLYEGMDIVIIKRKK